MVELPAILRMLQAAEHIGATAADVRRVLLRAIASFSERSGCCPSCDESIESYEQALRLYQEAVEEQRQHEASMTPESHPYVVSSSGKIHTCACRSQPGQRIIEHPGATLQEFTHGSRGHYYEVGVDSGARRLTTAEMATWLHRRKVVKRCKLCEPVLPGAYASEASDVESTARG
ncbi:hypothetical protein [Micromonospora matsumotoense]|uniref:hypothetical protein n=1 Tax=Micromonospora matsumotoense TaxID=121616 RepID=UPI003411A786